MLSANLGVGGDELQEGNFVMSSHYLAYRAVRPHLVVGARAGAFLEPGLGVGDTDRDTSVFDVGPVVGVSRGVGRVTAVASAGPVLTVARRHTDFRSEEPPAERVVTGGVALDAGASFRLSGPLGIGVHAATNVNPEVIVMTAGLSLDATFGD